MQYLIILPPLDAKKHEDIRRRLANDEDVSGWYQLFENNWVMDMSYAYVPNLQEKFIELFGDLTDNTFVALPADSYPIIGIYDQDAANLKQLHKDWLKNKPQQITVQKNKKAVMPEGIIPLEHLMLNEHTSRTIDRYLLGLKFEDTALEEKGIDFSDGMQNVLISGPPGVGKTTLALSLAQEIVEAKYGLPGAPVKLAKQADVIGEYCGHTTNKLNRLFKDTASGVLILDEIDKYARIAKFGDEAIDTLNTYMGTNPNNPIIIGTLYEKSATAFLGGDVGLGSRFRTNISLAPQTDDDLVKIFRNNVIGKGMQVAPDALDAVRSLMETLRTSKKSSFGNAREITNLMAAIRENMATRKHKADVTNEQFDWTILVEDIPVKDRDSSLLVKRPKPEHMGKRRAPISDEKVVQLRPKTTTRPTNTTT